MSGKKWNLNKGNKFRCPCVQKPKHCTVYAGCTDDAAAVAVLPYHWTPRRGGSILANYLNKRKEDHFKVMKDLEESAVIINEEIESKIRVLAETLLCHINNNQCEIDCVIKENNSIKGSLSVDSRNEALKSIEKIISERVQEISNFKEKALQLENERASGLRKVLHDHFNSVISVGHVSPKDLLQEFDEKIYEINQQLLSNCSAYHELEAQLNAKASQSQTKARSLINQLCLGVMVTGRGHSAINCPTTNTVQKRSTSAHTKVNFDKSLPDQTMHVKELEICSTKLTEEYQKAVANLYTNFLTKLNNLFIRLGDSNYIQKNICCKNEVSFFDEKLEQTISYLSGANVDLTMSCGQNLSELADCIKLIQNSLKSVGNQLKDTYTLLHEACHLWDDHMIRVALAQKLTLAAVEDLISRHDSLELANELNFNILFEQLATANDVDKLNQYYDALLTLLKLKSDEYAYHSDAEIGRLNEFINIHIPLTNAVQAEFDLFTSKHPIGRLQVRGSEDSFQDARPRISGCDVKVALSREIFQTEVQGMALNNWRDGFLESFRNNLPLLSEKLNHQVRLWVNERSRPLKKRFSLKLMTLDVRKERVTAARNVRLAELLQHEACLESHLEALYGLVNSLPTEVSQFITLDTSILYPICQWLEGIKKGMEELEAPEVDVEVKRLKMMSYSSRLSNHQRLFEESLDSIVDLCKDIIANRIQMARVSNVRFMSHLMLHNEGGHYSAVEAVKVAVALVKGGDALESCVNKSLDALNHRRAELLSQIDRMIHSLQTTVDVALKETGKGSIERKKLQTNKKK